MSPRVLWLTGPPGSGKTTAGRTAAARLGLEFRSAGELFRAEAARRGLGLPEFSRYAEEHAEVDRALDEGLMAEARPGALLEGRVVGALLRRRGTPVFGLRVDAREEVRAARLAGRDHVPVAEALARMRERSESERLRYRKFYGIDLDREPIDATLDSSDDPKELVAERLERILKDSGALP